jgi:hypothetical protein
VLKHVKPETVSAEFLECDADYLLKDLPAQSPARRSDYDAHDLDGAVPEHKPSQDGKALKLA